MFSSLEIISNTTGYKDVEPYQVPCNDVCVHSHIGEINMVHWMLVLFMVTSNSGNVIKTDLVFETKQKCFAYESEIAKETVASINNVGDVMKKEGKAQEEINRSISWISMQLPRGTCIPTVSAVTVKT